MKITKRQLRRIIKEEKARLLRETTPGAAGQAAMGGLTPADQAFAAAVDADAETGRTLKISSENAEAVEKAKSAIEEQLNSLYHNHFLENADLIAILEQMIKDINSGFVGEPT